MRGTLAQQLEKLNAELDELHRHLQTYSNEQLNRQPDNGGWSALQALYHIYLVEGYAVKYCRKKLSFNPEIRKAGLWSRFNRTLVIAYLSSPFKFKAPKAVNTGAFPETIEMEPFMAQWKDQRATLKDFLLEVPDKYLDTALYKHPFGGRLSLQGMLAFLSTHWKRHRKQALRALSVL